ncbi:MAG TPA: cupin domain-containing protein [Flexilinea sp.]|mgnify:FL=1|nr:cupin domain-containing protein [Flexilinea sp.]
MNLNADNLIRQLQLEPHAEGGWYRRIWLSNTFIPAESLPQEYGGDRNSAGIIYYLLRRDECSVWHRLKSPETWLWLYGGTLEITLGGTREQPIKDQTFLLTPFGNSDGTHFLTIEPHTWQTAKPVGDEFVLVACIMSPAFTPKDWELA